MTAHLRVVGPDERVPSWWRRIERRTRPARVALSRVLLRVAGGCAPEAVGVRAYGHDGEEVARLVALGPSQTTITELIAETASALTNKPNPEPSA